MSRRVGIVGLHHETNTYSAHPASLEDFEAFELLTGTDIATRHRDTGSVIGGFYDATDLDLVPVFSACSWPSGPIDDGALEQFFAEIDAGLRAAGTLDGLLLNLHGAMVGEGTSDVEGAVVTLARDVVGDVPFGAVLDLHANPSPRLAEATEILISYDTYPHIDMRARGLEVAGLVADILGGRRLRTMEAKLPLLVCPLAQGTDVDPMRGLQRRAAERARDAGVARVCIVGGFAYSDVDRAGMTVLVIHDEGAELAASDVLRATIDDITAHADAFAVARDNTATAVAKALASRRKPVFLADVADNIGGGSPGDGTALLRELLAVGATGAIVTIADRDVARLATGLGVGADLDTDLGAKTDRNHGEPLHIRGRVERLSDGNYRTEGYWMTGQTFSMGCTAVVSVAGNTVMITEHAVPPFHAEQFSSVGIDVRRASIVVMKGAVAWRGAYGDIAGDIIEVATPGICPVDLSTLPRSHEPMTY